MTWRLFPTLQEPVPITAATGIGGDVSEWLQDWRLPVRFLAGLGSHLQQFYVVDPIGLGLPEAVQYDKFGYLWADPVRIPLRLQPGLNPELFYPVFILNDLTQLNWYQAFGEPVRYLPGLGTVYQQFFDYDRVPRIEDHKYDKYGYAWSEPVRRTYRISTSLGVSRANHRSELE